jgi:protein-L-isoaspartate(D-aspartate) O-methyltransferase
LFLALSLWIVVFSIRAEPLVAAAGAGTLAAGLLFHVVWRRLGYDNVHVRHGDGYAGWPSEAPFDAILVTAAPPAIPELLVEQLAPGGRMVVPVGEGSQDLQVLVQTDGRLERRSVLPVRFVPMTGAARGE